eukprot:s350_g31.t1
MEPYHVAQDGDSYLINAYPDGQAAHDTQDTAMSDNQHDAYPSESEASDSAFASPGQEDRGRDSASIDESLQRFHVFRLGFPQSFGRLRWGNDAHLLLDAARLVRVPSAQFVGFHHLNVRPDDQTLQEASIILQHVGDIAPGSTQRLVLIDLELHPFPIGTSVPVAPRVMRKVFKVVPTLVRQHLLILAGVSAYCEWSPQECFVFCNRVLWPAQDVGPRRISHGMYFRIVLPPPPDSRWEIGHTIKVFQECADLFDMPEAGRLAVGVLSYTYADSSESMPGAGTSSGPAPMHHKGADLGPYDIDVPTMHAPAAYRQPLQPAHDGSLRWLMDLGQLFVDNAEDEAFENEPLLYVQTWPPQPRSHYFACHVIVKQKSVRAEKPGIVTALFEGSRHDGFIQGAYYLPHFTRAQDVIDAMEIEPLCSGRRCFVHAGEVPVHLVQGTEVHAGFSVRVRVRDPNAQMPLPPIGSDDHFEDIAFLQACVSRPPVRQHGLQLPGPADSSEDRRFTMNVTASEFRPGQFPIPDQPAYLDDIYQLWFQHAFSWEDEQFERRFLTWFVDHRAAPAHCFHSRAVVLTEDFATWDAAFKEPWMPFIDHAAALEIHVVAPQPPHIEPNVIAHVILVQAPADALVTSLVSIFDTARYGAVPARAAVTTNEHIAVEHLLLVCQYDLSCLFPNQLLSCEAWYAQERLNPGVPLPGRSGYSIVIHMQRNSAASVQSHRHDRPLISLQQALSLQPHLVPVHLIDGATSPDLPSHVLLAEPFTAEDVESELAVLGAPRHVYLLGTTGFAFCVPINWPFDGSRPNETYVFFPLEGMDRDDVSVHGSSVELSDMEQLRLLYAIGFTRAVLISHIKVRPTLHLVQFHNNQPALEQLSHKPRQATPWPASCVPGIHIWNCLNSSVKSCRNMTHLRASNMICAALIVLSFTLTEAPKHTTDASRLWVQEHDVPDAWSFVVLGERYRPAPEPSEIVFLGWQAQQVTYETDLSHYLGSDQIGSEFAEREALFWAAIWRLSANLTTPTVFRSDSVTTAAQSTGKFGCHDGHPTFCSLRSVMQALEASLPSFGFLVEHVRGHAGDVWNELADHLAKVLHADPRRLFVRLAHSCMHCLFLVLHGPQSGRPLQERRSWWSATSELIRQYRADLPLFVLMDANAKTGPSCEPMIFNCADVSSANTEYLRSFLHDHDLCLPSTSDVHQGEHATWTGVDGLSQHRIDYVAVPQQALSQCTLSTVVEEFEPGSRFDDHRAVALQLQWHTSSSGSSDASKSSLSYNRAAIGQKAADIDLSCFRAQPWHTDIETQVCHFNRAILQSLHESCPIGRSCPKKPFFTEEVWQLRVAKLHLRRRLQLARKQTGRDALRLVFWIWRKAPTSADFHDDLSQHLAHGATVLCAMVHLNCEYFSVARKLRFALQHCKRQQLATELSATSDKTSAGEILHLLRPYIGPSNPKKQKRKGLLKSDGSLCCTPEEATLRWTEFFCNMEGGSSITDSDYRQKWMQNLAHFRDTGALTLPLTEVPSLVDLEAAFRRVAVGKASHRRRWNAARNLSLPCHCLSQDDLSHALEELLVRPRSD